MGHPEAGKTSFVNVGSLTLNDVVKVARDGWRVDELPKDVRAKGKESSDWVDTVVGQIEQARPYYGINTGFGSLAGKSAFRDEYHTRLLSRNLIMSHSAGVGDYFEEEIVRAAMLLRANSLAQGLSGVRPEVLEKLVDMLNERVYPAVPSKGSLGSSGDLAPLSHLVLAMTKAPLTADGGTEEELDISTGEAFMPVGTGEYRDDVDDTYHMTTHRTNGEQTLWRRVDGENAMVVVGGALELRAKEGVALNNGTTFSTSIAALTLHDALNLMDNAELALAMTLEAVRGFRDPFFPEIHQARGHAGAKITAMNVLRYVDGSELLDAGDTDRDPERIPPQDPYSIRCAPQVLGTARDALSFVKGVIDIEINAATDNPLIFVDLPDSREYKAVSGGNFHGEPIAMAMDFLGIAVAELGNIAERRVFKLTDYKTSDEKDGLPGMLVESTVETEGLNSGFMIPQYTAASLVSECKTLAHPDSVDSIPSSANQEDHVSMSLNAALHARQIVDNIEAVIAIEFFCAAQALRIRQRQAHTARRRLGIGTQAALNRIASEVDYLARDRVLYPDIRTLISMVRKGELVELATQAAG